MDCQYDHGSVSETVIEDLLATSVRKQSKVVGKRPCRFSPHEHTVELQVMKWVTPDEEISMRSHASSAGKSSTESVDKHIALAIG